MGHLHPARLRYVALCICYYRPAKGQLLHASRGIICLSCLMAYLQWSQTNESGHCFIMDSQIRSSVILLRLLISTDMSCDIMDFCVYYSALMSRVSGLTMAFMLFVAVNVL